MERSLRQIVTGNSLGANHGRTKSTFVHAQWQNRLTDIPVCRSMTVVHPAVLSVMTFWTFRHELSTAQPVHHHHSIQDVRTSRGWGHPGSMVTTKCNQNRYGHCLRSAIQVAAESRRTWVEPVRYLNGRRLTIHDWLACYWPPSCHAQQTLAHGGTACPLLEKIWGGGAAFRSKSGWRWHADGPNGL